jgi:hypothetical protein
VKKFERTTSFFSLHFFHHQEALFAESFKMSHVISVLNDREFVELPAEIVNGYGEIFTTHCDVVISWIGLQCCYFLVIEGDQIIREKEKQKTEELDDEGRMGDLVLFVYVTSYFRTLNNVLQGKDKVITEMF